MTTTVDPCCGNCAHWDTREGMVGFCPEITDYLRLTPGLMVQGLAPCRTAASGRCTRFDPSEEALQEARAERTHSLDLHRAAGTDYPATLGV